MEARVGSHFAFLLEELETVEEQNGTAMTLNYCNLAEFPRDLLTNKYCHVNLQKLYLKRNRIASIVSSQFMIVSSLVLSPECLQPCMLS